MSTYKVTIPENKINFFLEFLEIIGAKYEKNEDYKFMLSDEQKHILDCQDNLKENEYYDSDLFLDEIKKENGL